MRRGSERRQQRCCRHDGAGRVGSSRRARGLPVLGASMMAPLPFGSTGSSRSGSPPAGRTGALAVQRGTQGRPDSAVSRKRPRRGHPPRSPLQRSAPTRTLRRRLPRASTRVDGGRPGCPTQGMGDVAGGRQSLRRGRSGVRQTQRPARHLLTRDDHHCLACASGMAGPGPASRGLLVGARLSRCRRSAARLTGGSDRPPLGSTCASRGRGDETDPKVPP